jgi:hypothetical protein
MYCAVVCFSWSVMQNFFFFLGRIKIRTDPQQKKKYFLVLEISDVTAKDAGNYKVTAKNALGESNATIRLNFDS